MELHVVIRGKRSSWQDRTAGIPSGTFVCVAHVYCSVHYNTEVASSLLSRKEFRWKVYANTSTRRGVRGDLE